MSTTITDATDRVAKPAPDISIVIPHHNDVPRLEICLTHLAKNDLTGVEVIVVDNNSPASLDHLHALFPDVRFLIEEAPGAGPTRNRGVAASAGPILAFLDADCIPAQDWVATIRDVAHQADLIGGRVDVHDETPPPRNGSQAFEKVFGYNFKYYIEQQGACGAGNLVTHRAVFDRVGPFRPAVSEDTDWTRRAVSMGFKLVYRDTLRVSHPSRGTWPALRQKWHRMCQESWALAQSDAPGLGIRLRWAVKALAMPASALAHIPRILRSSKLDLWSERLAAVGVLIRLRWQRMIWMLMQTLGQKI